MTRLALMSCALLTLLAASQVHGANEYKKTQNGIRDFIASNEWRALIPLYETRVYENGHVVNEPDDESIMPGQSVKVASRNSPFFNVSRKGMVKLQVKHPQGICKFTIRFFFNDSIGEDAERDLATFRKMVGLIMEPVPTE